MTKTSFLLAALALPLPAGAEFFLPGSDWESVTDGHRFAEGMAFDFNGHFLFTDSDGLSSYGVNVLARYFSGTDHVRPFYYFAYQLPVDFLPWTLLLPAVYVVARRHIFPAAAKRVICSRVHKPSSTVGVDGCGCSVSILPLRLKLALS